MLGGLLLTGFREPGGPDYNNWGCLYGNKILTNNDPMPEKFTGLMVCKDEKSGKVTSKINQKNGQRHGFVGQYDKKTGKPIVELNYKDGKLHGFQKGYMDYEPFRLIEEFNYVDGNQRGVQKYYNYETGKLETVKFLDVAGNDTTEVKYNSKGQLRYLDCGKESVVPQDNDWCGRKGKTSSLKFYDDDSISETGGFLNNLKQGPWTRYSGGKAVKTVTYDKGKEGKSVEKDASGKVAKVDNVKDGNGSKIEYFKGTKDKAKEEVWKSGKLAKRVEYYQNGEKKNQETYSGDQIIIEGFNDDGVLTQKNFYVKANNYYGREQHGKSTRWNDDGTIFYEENYDHGKQHGAQIMYGPKKVVVSRTEYNKGVLVSKKEYDAQGKLKLSEEYLPDGSKKKKKKK